MNENFPADILERQFWVFHRTNPAVYSELVNLALKLRRGGHEHYGIGALFEVIRFHRALETTDREFKLNNNHRALYARLIMKNVPELDGFFSLRVRQVRDTQHLAPETTWRNEEEGLPNQT